MRIGRLKKAESLGVGSRPRVALPSISNPLPIFTSWIAGEQDQTSSAPDCVFCLIVAGRIPAAKIFEDGQVLAIMDIRSINEGHVLVMPKPHYPSLTDLPGDV